MYKAQDLIEPGCLLVAPPGMPDARFRETVIMIMSHGEEGSWGLVINRGLGYSSTEALAAAGQHFRLDPDPELYWGGPINPGVIWVLHTADWQIAATQEITDHYSVTSHRHMFDHLRRVQPRYSRIFSGSAVWGPDQLPAEIAGESPWTSRSSWLMCQTPDPAWLLSQPNQDLWTSAISLSAQQAVRDWL